MEEHLVSQRLAHLMERPEVGEIEQLVTEYHVFIGSHRVPVTVKIYFSPHIGKYTGVADHAVKTRAQATSYKSIHPQDTPEDAFCDAIEGMLMFYKDDEAPGCLIKDDTD